MYTKPRVIPVLSIENGDLVKTLKFKNPRYIGDPVNTVKIFNDKSADELCLLDISASKEHKEPNFKLLQEVANEAFMPLSYGGGLTNLNQVKKIIQMGFEKVVFNTSFFTNPSLIKESVKFLGSSSVVICIDVKKDIFNKYKFYSHDGTKEVVTSFEELIKRIKDYEVGEVIINSIQNDGEMGGYDLKLIENFGNKLDIPVIALGGAKNKEDFELALRSGADAVAASSMFIFYGKMKAVLVSYLSF